MRKKYAAKRRLEFESLEDRALLTGTVRTALVNGQLSITGDNSSNSVQLSANGSTWTVKGDDTAIVGPTSFSGVKSLSVNLGKGDDSITMSRISMTGSLDVVYLPSDTGTKDTELYTVSAGKVSITNAASGANTVVLSQVTTSLTGVNGVYVNTGVGNDLIQLSGVNSATNVQVLAGNGNNYVVLNAVQTHSLESILQTGTGSDTIVASSYQGSTALTIKSGNGSDQVVLNAVNMGAGTLLVDVGPGSGDSITVSNSTARAAYFLDTGGTGGQLTGANNRFSTLVIGANITGRLL